MKPTVGFIGIGNMGSGMASNLLKNGFPLIAYDVRPEAIAHLIPLGARSAESPREIGEVARTVVVMVLNYAQMHEAILGPQGVASTLAPGSTVIGSSTISPTQAKILETVLAERQLNYIDAPVSGGKFGAADGTLTIMVGAREDVFVAQRQILESMSSHLYHCGPVGTGQVAKMCNQLMAGVTLVATAECLSLGAVAGIDLQRLYEIVTHGTGDSWMFRNRANRMMEGDFETRGRLDIFLKDLGIALEMAEQGQLPLLVASAARQVVMMAAAEGYATADDSAVVKVLERFSGVRVHADE